MLVPGAEGRTDAFSRLLREAGAEPIAAPTIRILPPSDAAPLAGAAANLASYDWVVFTSRNAVDAIFDALALRGGGLESFGPAKLCAVGPRTAEALRRRGARVDLEPERGHRDALAEALLAAIREPSRARVLFPRSSIAPATLAEALRGRGVRVDDVVAYENHPPSPEQAEALRALFRDRGIDAIGFTSSSTVENLLAALGEEAHELLSSVTIAAIGPSTAATAKRKNLDVTVEAARHTTEGLVAALVAYFDGMEPT